jgi:hypothetical protein
VRTGQKFLATLMCALSTTLVSFGSGAQDLAQTGKALELITKFADSMCYTIAQEGSSTSVAVQGKAKAEISKLLRRLAELGIEGAASGQSSEYAGLLQKDLLAGIRETSGCKERIYNDLRDRVLPAKKPGEKITVTTSPVRVANFDFSVERCRVVQNDRIECSLAITNLGATRKLSLASERCCQIYDYNSNTANAVAARVANQESVLERYKGLSFEVVGGASPARAIILFESLPTQIDSLAELKLQIHVGGHKQPPVVIKRIAVQNS